MQTEFIIVIILLLFTGSLQGYLFFTEKNTIMYYINNKLMIGKKHYVTYRSKDNSISIFLIDIVKDEEYHIADIIEKGFFTYYVAKDKTFVYNGLTKRVKEKPNA